MNEGPPPPKRVCLDKKAWDAMTKEDFQQRWAEQEAYIDALMSGQATADGNKQQYEAARRENVLVMRLTTKEQELQDFGTQIEELKRAQNPSTTHLHTMTLDPAVNLMFQRMKKEMDVCKEKLEQAQNDLASWKFTPDGQTGKRLMAKCRMLLQENEELGKVISAGRTAKLEGEIALEKKFVEEMKASQAETDEFLMEMDEDVEGLQTTILVLQQQLKEAKDQITHLEEVNTKLQQTTTYNQTSTGSSKNTVDCNAMTVDISIVKQEQDSSTPPAYSTSRGQVVDSSSGITTAGAERTTHMYGDVPENTTSNGQHKEEVMDTTEEKNYSKTGQQQGTQQQDNGQMVNNHHVNHHHHSPLLVQQTDGKVASSKESPLSPVNRTSGLSPTLPPAQPTKDNVAVQGAQQQSWTEGKLSGGQAVGGELIQNGLISSQYDSQSDDS